MTNEPNSKSNPSGGQPNEADTDFSDYNAPFEGDGEGEGEPISEYEEPKQNDIRWEPLPPRGRRRSRNVRPLPTVEELAELRVDRERRSVTSLTPVKSRTLRQEPGAKSEQPSGNGGTEGRRALEEEVQKCVDAVAALDGTQDDGELLYRRVLVQVMRLHVYTRSHPDDLDQLLKDKGIRLNGRTRNEITPLMRLVYAQSVKRSNLSRNSAALRFAADNGVDPENLLAFIDGNGGVAKCAKQDREAHPSREAARAEEKRAARLEASREAGIVFEVPALRKVVTSPFACWLVEPLKGGRFRVLGVREEVGSAITRYAPIKA